MLGRTSSALGFGAETFDFVEGFHLSAAVQSGAQTGGKSSLVPLTQGPELGTSGRYGLSGLSNGSNYPLAADGLAFRLSPPTAIGWYMGWTCSTPTSAGFGFRALERPSAPGSVYCLYKLSGRSHGI